MIFLVGNVSKFLRPTSDEKSDAKVEKHLLVAALKLKMWEKREKNVRKNSDIFNFSSTMRSHFSTCAIFQLFNFSTFTFKHPLLKNGLL